MFERRKYEDDNFYMLRLTAVSLAALSLLLLLLLLIFNDGLDFPEMPGTQLIGLAFFPAGLMIGLLLALRRELLGGAVAVGSVAAFYLFSGFLPAGVLAWGWWFVFFAIPGALFIAYGIAVTRADEAVTRKNDSKIKNIYEIRVVEAQTSGADSTEDETNSPTRLAA